MTETVFPPIRPRDAKDDEFHEFVVRHGWFWNVMLLNGTEYAFDPDDVDPCRYGFTTADAFRNLVAGAPESVATFNCVEGWHARPKGMSTWTPRAATRADAVREAYFRQEAERARHKDVDMSKFFKGLE